MHQTPRAPYRASSPAASPQTNPARTNNPRDASHDASATSPAASPPPPPSSGSGPGPSKDSIKKLDQIIQNVFSKASTLILQERMRVTPTLVSKTFERKTSKWFQLETVEIDDFRDEFRAWKQSGAFENQPRPLVIETYLDASRLKAGQSLVALDENGKRWDVLESLNSSDMSSDSSSGGGGGGPSKPKSLITLERWKIELKSSMPDEPLEFGSLLPSVYKKAIVLLRSIYTATGILPAWKAARRSKTKNVHPALQVFCRVSSDPTSTRSYDPLRVPLFDGRGDVSTDYMIGDLEVPVGRFYISVSYRNQCAFDVVETESLLSSRIGIAISDEMFKPSFARRGSERQPAHEIGSVPYYRQEPHITDNQQRYGSLSTFHGEGPTGTSPISALRAVKAPGSEAGSPPRNRTEIADVPPNSLPIAGLARRPSLRAAEGAGRRPSVSFQSSPFKQGSLSASPVPRLHDYEPAASPHSLGRPGSGTAAHARNRSSLTAGMPASLRGGPPPATATDGPVVGSPRPTGTNRFSSSFTHRRSRPSFGGTSRGDDDQNSSGKQSLSSSVVQPGSGLLNETGGGGSSGSFQTDDDNIQDFLKALDTKKTLQSFASSSKKGESATSKTSAQLSRFQLMRESNNALTESLNTSTQLQRSPSSSSRQLGNIPAMSTSTSPGKPLSPHTPHTPAVPSRLSENSSANYTSPVRGAALARNVVGLSQQAPAAGPVTTTTAEGTTAIDIPLSPRPYARRANSVVPNTVLADDDEVDAHRSISLGADDRDPPSLSALLGRNLATEERAEVGVGPILGAAPDIAAAASEDMLQQGSSSAEREARPPGGLFSGFSSSPYGRRYGSSAGRGMTPPHSGSGSLVGSAGRYGRGYSRGEGTSGYSGGSGGGAEEPEDELLLFDMSEINREQSRRSLEEGRGGYESGRGSRRW